MAIRLGDSAPIFKVQTTEGSIDFYDWMGNDWAVLFSHPKDYTPVCTTELGQVAKLKPESDKRGVKVIGLSVDGVRDHHGWSKDIEETQGAKLNSHGGGTTVNRAASTDPTDSRWSKVSAVALRVRATRRR